MRPELSFALKKDWELKKMVEQDKFMFKLDEMFSFIGYV